MAGAGTRTSNFSSDPKPLIQLLGRPLFSWALDGLPIKQATDLTIITNQEVANHPSFNPLLERHLPNSINTHVIVLKNQTSGQAETIKLGSKHLPEDNGLLIFNCDTFITNDFPEDYTDWDGLLGTFKSDDPGMSYVKTSGRNVLETVEKQVISDQASTGLYYFKNRELFLEAYNHIEHVNETFVAPLFNYLISREFKVGCFDTRRVVPLGTAQEILNSNLGEPL